MAQTTRFETLNKNNYDTWKLFVEALLVKNDLWQYVTDEKPEIDQNNQGSINAAREWEKNDAKARSDIILSISAGELKQIKGCTTARAVWSKLRDTYQSKGPARKATLLKQLTALKMQNGSDAREHVKHFFDIVDNINEIGVEIDSDLLAIMLLSSLSSEFDSFKCAIESRDELPSLEMLRVKIVEQSDARRSNNRGTASDALYTEKRWKKSQPKTRNNTAESSKREKMSNRTFYLNENGEDEETESARPCLEKPPSPMKQPEPVLLTPSRIRRVSVKAIEAIQRGGWNNKLDFLFSCISLSVGLGNVWRFPYLCYKNGGGAFLVTYGIAMIFCGIPMFYQEVAIGQYLGSGGMTFVGQLCPLLKGVGYATMTIVFLLDVYYCIIIAWTLYYLICTFATLPYLPWGDCNNWWNTENCSVGELHARNSSRTSNTMLFNGTRRTTPVEEFFE